MDEITIEKTMHEELQKRQVIHLQLDIIHKQSIHTCNLDFIGAIVSTPTEYCEEFS